MSIYKVRDVKSKSKPISWDDFINDLESWKLRDIKKIANLIPWEKVILEGKFQKRYQSVALQYIDIGKFAWLNFEDDAIRANSSRINWENKRLPCYIFDALDEKTVEELGETNPSIHLAFSFSENSRWESIREHLLTLGKDDARIYTINWVRRSKTIKEEDAIEIYGKFNFQTYRIIFIDALMKNKNIDLNKWSSLLLLLNL